MLVAVFGVLQREAVAPAFDPRAVPLDDDGEGPPSAYNLMTTLRVNPQAQHNRGGRP